MSVVAAVKKAKDRCPCCGLAIELDGSEPRHEAFDEEDGVVAFRKVCPGCEVVLTIFPSLEVAS